MSAVSRFMYIAIISDIHDNLVNLQKCLDYIKDKNIEQTICCGDATNSETLKFLNDNFPAPIHLVRGNMEVYDDEDFIGLDNIKYYGRTGRVKIGKYMIGICHEPYFIERLIKAGKYDIIFYGHTHKPWTEKKSGVLTINPGNLAGVMYRATFAVWDTEKGEIKLVEVDEL